MITVYYRKVFPLQEENTFVESLLKKVDKRRREKLFQAKNNGQNEKVRAVQLSAGCLIYDVLCEWLGLSPENTPPFDIAYGENGKPYLPGREDIYFNLSHSGDYVCAAVSDNPVGVDIQEKPVKQKETAVRDRGRKIAERFFTSADREYLSACGEDKYRDLFFRMWSIKESYVKLTGEGMSRGLSGFEIDWQARKIVTEENGKTAAFFWEGKELENYSLCVCSHFHQSEVLWKEMRNTTENTAFSYGK